MTHDLKTLPQYWDAVERGYKTFEVRKDDRGFQKGDTIRLLRMDRQYFEEAYKVEEPERALELRVTYVMDGGQFGIEPGYVVMGVEKVPSHVDCVGLADKMNQMRLQEINRLGRQLSEMRLPNQIESNEPDGGAA